MTSPSYHNKWIHALLTGVPSLLIAYLLPVTGTIPSVLPLQYRLDCLSKLWYVMPSIALSGDEKFSGLIMRKSIQPIDKKGVGILGGSVMSTQFIV